MKQFFLSSYILNNTYVIVTPVIYRNNIILARARVEIQDRDRTLRNTLSEQAVNNTYHRSTAYRIGSTILFCVGGVICSTKNVWRNNTSCFVVYMNSDADTDFVVQLAINVKSSDKISELLEDRW